MRLEATIPDVRGVAVNELAEQLGVSKSQLVDEAITLFLMAVREIKSGRRLVAVDPFSREPSRELVMPSFSALEWSQRERLELTGKSIQKVAAMVENPAKAGSALRKAMKRSKR